MGKFGKWIAGGLGWAFFGPVGGLLGFVIGSFLEADQQRPTQKTGTTTTGDFAVSLLVLIAAVMKADGRVVQSELNYVKKYLVRTFGESSAKEAVIILRDLLKQDIPIRDVSTQIGQRLDYSSKLQMIHLLFEVAYADKQLHKQEIDIINIVCSYMGIDSKDFESIKAMYYKDTDSLYKILEIEPDATDEEVKKAYRTMANKFHPDKVEYLGDDFKKVANEKFKKVNEAYEAIKKARNIK